MQIYLMLNKNVRACEKKTLYLTTDRPPIAVAYWTCQGKLRGYGAFAFACATATISCLGLYMANMRANFAFQLSDRKA